jgi:hypothetical protein
MKAVAIHNSNADLLMWNCSIALLLLDKRRNIEQVVAMQTLKYYMDILWKCTVSEVGW